MPAPASASPLPTAATAAQRASEIRFALVGQLMGANVWGLFDTAGYSYNDYAVRSGYWPRLYDLSIPEGSFQPQAASAMPSPVEAAGVLFTATVLLRSDLKWTDGSPFTADDAAFTVNTALSFQLGFDWRSFYDPAWLDHAEALDAQTIKFYFKNAPSVAQWQYGALQGPIVQQAYWSSRISSASALLPTADSLAKVGDLSAKVADLQARVQALITAGRTASGEEARRLAAQLQNQQGNLDHAHNDLAKEQIQVDSALDSARRALYAIQAQDEPTLGTWMPVGNSNDMWTNATNPSHPFGTPNFDRAVYRLYSDPSAAVAAIDAGAVDAVLDPHGLASNFRSQHAPQDTLIDSPTSVAYFLVVNPARQELADPALRRALFCSIDRSGLSQSQLAAPLSSFVPPANAAWFYPQATVSCGNGYDPLKAFDPSRAVAILKSAGYTWTTEPAGEQAGSGLTQPNGLPFPPIALLAPAGEAGAQGLAAAQAIAQSAAYLGIRLTLQTVDPADVRFAVLSSHQGYDLAIQGWRLSRYPAYLCNWFGDGNPFGYAELQIQADCAILAGASDLEAARRQVYDIQSVLAQNPGFIPLYSGLAFDLTRGIAYPFDHVLDGLGGVYGAPALALPAPP